jgi:GTP-binding protein
MDLAIRDARFVATAVREDGLPPPAFAEVAFGGKSNVGKSSLVNLLVQRRKLVRTSSTPGATRGLSLFRVELARGEERATIDLVDLPGYGFAQRSKAERKSWGPMIEGFLERRAGLRAVVVIVDVRRGIGEEDAQLLEYLAHLGKTAIVVATKVDKLSASERSKALAALPKGTIAASAETGEGRERIWARILAAAGIFAPAGGVPHGDTR